MICVLNMYMKQALTKLVQSVKWLATDGVTRVQFPELSLLPYVHTVLPSAKPLHYEIGHSPPSSAEVNVWSFVSTMPSWHDV